MHPKSDSLLIKKQNYGGDSPRGRDCPQERNLFGRINKRFKRNLNMKDFKKFVESLFVVWGIIFGLFTFSRLNLIGNFHYTDNISLNFLIDLSGIIGIILFVYKIFEFKVNRDYEDKDEFEKEIRKEYERKNQTNIGSD